MIKVKTYIKENKLKVMVGVILLAFIVRGCNCLQNHKSVEPESGSGSNTAEESDTRYA
jgi:predicted negative regulator of RcsB-dependent stress response|tara:strand:+ start:532 stop:705 length:174 start_codon:yes stop_codon:yes gene_type:complete